MISLKFLKFITNIFLSILCIGCTQSEYRSLVENEKAKGVRMDSIMLGINLGDSQQLFYDKCSKLNAAKLVGVGGNASVQYLFIDSLVHDPPEKLNMFFYPRFDEKSTIVEMKAEISYLGWSPWNVKYSSDSLVVKTVLLLEKWYGGNSFISVKTQEGKLISVKVDGNRRIIVDELNEQAVLVKIQNLSHPLFNE